MPGITLAAAGAMGPGIGIGIHALVNIPRTFYARDERRTVIAPFVVPQGAGALLVVTF